MTRVFELPEFLQDCGADPIHARMLDELPDDIDKTEGGFPWDFTRPTALIAAELLEFYIPEAIKLMFPQWSSGSFLDYLAAGSQTKRKASTYAEAELTLTGEPGTIVPAGTVFATEAKNDQPSIEFAAVENCILDEEGNGTVLVREVPDDVRAEDAAATLEELAQKLRLHSADRAALRDEVLHTVACKSAIKAGMTSDPAELRALAAQVQSGAVRYCPHGRPVAVKLSEYEIEKMFKRA